jgi:hypothetical protein
MKLVSSADLRVRFGFGNIDTLVAAADNAAEEATLHLESDLRTVLLQDSYSDAFLMSDSDRRKEMLKLKLTAGFVADGFVIGTGLTKADAAADTSLTEQVNLDQEQGVLILVDVSLSRWVSVRYTAGFAAVASPNTDNMFDTSTCPEWLLKAAELKAISLMADAPELENKDGSIIKGKNYAQQYEAVIARKIRYVPDTRLPTM